ncbi:MAG: 30S ribosomal protein S17 [Candidatus Omnitrophota bacterium]|nr:MAG: 30S ribosomal protein S17 [Candidatus Omnitrophota bacterium]
MGKRKEFIGTVIGDKMNKTITVKIMQVSKHRKYRRLIPKFNKFKVHDEKNEAKVGDKVRIQETRPLSKDKRFRMVSIVEKAVVVENPQPEGKS